MSTRITSVLVGISFRKAFRILEPFSISYCTKMEKSTFLRSIFRVLNTVALKKAYEMMKRVTI